MADLAPTAQRIVLFTREPEGNFYQAAQEAIRNCGHRLVCVVTSAGPRTRRTDRYLEIVSQTPLSTDVIISNFPSHWAGMLAPLQPDLILVLGWSWKLPADVIALPRLGAINVHNALLPKYRGRGDLALQWTLRNDEPHYGLTFHWVDSDFDTGPILVQTQIPIGDDDDGNSLNDRLNAAALDVLPSVIDMAVRGEPGTPQPDGGFYCQPMEPAWRTIDWNSPARTVHNQVRSWLGMGAEATIDGRSFCITRTRLLPTTTTDAIPGTLLAQRDGTLVVQCANSPIEVLAYTDHGVSDAHT